MPPPIKPVKSRKDLYKKYEVQDITPGGPVSTGPRSPRQSLYDKYSIDTAADTAIDVEEPPEEEEDTGILGRLKDLGLSTLKGAIGLPEAGVGIVDIFAGGRVGKALESIGYKPAEAKAVLDQYYSGQQKKAFRNVAEAHGIVDKAIAVLSNPSVIAQTVAEAGPQILGGGAIGRGILAAAPRIIGGAATAGAIGEGAITAGQIAEQVREEDPTGRLSLKQSALAAGAGIGTGLIGAFGNRLAAKLGIEDVDALVTGAARNATARHGLVKAVLYGAVEEGFLEELPQSIQEQVMQNAAQNKPLTDGVDDAAVLGLFAGAVMGAGSQIFSSRGGTKGGKTKPPPGTPPTPQQLIERQAKLDELAEQTKTHEEKRKENVVRTFTAVRAWSQATPEERKSTFPGLSEGEYLKPWKELGDPSKEMLKESVALNDPEVASPETATATATAGAPGAGPGVEIAGEGAAPPVPGAPSSVTVPPSREQVEAQIAERAKAREAAVPTEQFDLSPIERKLEQIDASRKASREAERTDQEIRRQVVVDRLTSQIEGEPVKQKGTTKPTGAKRMVGYRSKKSAGYGPTEGAGLYLSRHEALAHRLSRGEGMVKFEFDAPKNPLKVINEWLPVLDGQFDLLMEPINDSDSPWIRLNKQAAQATGLHTIEDLDLERGEFEKWLPDFARKLTALAKAEGYDAFYFSARGDEWTVLLDPALNATAGETYTPGEGREAATGPVEGRPLAQVGDDDLISSYNAVRDHYIRATKATKTKPGFSDDGSSLEESLGVHEDEMKQRGFPVYDRDAFTRVDELAAESTSQSQMERDKAIVFEDDELTGTVEGERRPISTRRNQELFNDPNLPEDVKREILGRNYDILQKLADGNLSEDSPSVIAIWDQQPYIKPEILAQFPHLVANKKRTRPPSAEGLASEARGEFEGVEGTPIQPEPPEPRQPSLEEQLANSIRAKGGEPTSALKVHAEYLASLIKQSKSEEFTEYYANILADGYTVKELDDAIFRALGGDDLASLAMKEGGKLGAALSKRAFDSLAQLYAQAWGSTVAKEGLQNAIDAIRGNPNGRVNVRVTDTSITFEDNGYGMTPSVMSNEFLDIGASYKEGDDNAGGFGLAKVVLFQKSKSVQVRSVYKANGRTWIATMEFSGKDWREDNITPPRVVQSTESDLPTGTTVRITLNPDANFDRYQAMVWVQNAQRYTRVGQINLFEKNWRDEWQEAGISATKKKEAATNPSPIYTETTPSHTVNVYESTEQMDHGINGSIEMHLLNNGFYQSTLRVPIKGEGPKFLTADVIPEVDTQDPDYPFTTSREVLKKPLMDSLEKMVGELSHRQALKLIRKLVAGLQTQARIGSTPYRVIDASLEVPPEFLQSLATHAYMEPFVHLVNEHLAKIAALSTANRGLGPVSDIDRKYRYYADIEDFEFGGVVVGSKFLGANFTLLGLDKIARDAGVDFDQVRDLEISASNMIVVNPYTMAWEVEEIKGLVDFRTAWVGRMVAVMPHEIAHQQARDEGDTFSSEYTRTNGAVSENLAPVYAVFREFWDTPFEYGMLDQRPVGHKRVTTYGEMIVADLQELKKHVQLNAANAYKSITAAAEAELRGGDDLSGSERNRSGDEGGVGGGPENGLQSGGPVREGQEGSGGTTQPETPQLPGTSPSNRLAGDLGPANTVVARELREQYKSETDPRVKFSILKKLQKLIQAMGKKAQSRKPRTSSEPTTRAEPTLAPSSPESAVPSPTPQASPVADAGASMAELERQRRVQQIAETEAARVIDARFQNMEDVAVAELDATGDVAAYSAAMKAILAMKAKAGEELPALRQLAVNRITKAEKPVTLGQPTNKMKLEEIKDTITSIKAQLANPNLDPAERAMLVAEQGRLDTARKKRKGKAEGGFLVNPFQRRRAKKMAQSGMTPSQEYMSNKVELDPDTANPWNWMKRLRALYMGTLRSSAPPNLAVKLFQESTGHDVQAHKHAGKLMEMMDGTATQAEAWLRGDGPFLPDGQGGFIMTGAPSLAAIGEIAQGEIEEFGWLWLASHALEQSALYGRDIGVDLAHAHEIFLRSPQHLHDAVEAANSYHTSLAQMQYLEGLISQEDVLKVAHETAHGPIEHVFNRELVDRIVQQMAQTGQTATQAVNSPAIQRILKTELPTRNMFEATIDITYRVVRAAKMNRFALSLVDMALSQPDLYADMIERVDHKVNVQKQGINSDRTEAAKAIFSVFGMTVSNERAAMYANMMGDQGLGIEDNILQVKRGGTIEFWKVDKLLLDSIKSLSPAEFGTMIKGLGKTAHVLRMGIVLDPMFIAMQLAVDQFQGWTNTRYGFVPVWDSFRGWWNLMKNTPMAQEAIRAGGVERSSLRVRTGLEEVMAGPNLSPLKQSLDHIRTLHPGKALNTLLTPLREATRMGEFIRAIEHGASPVEASWAARDLLGNYSVEGSWGTIRALHVMSAFSRPALAVVDKVGRTIKERPGQWFLRASTLAIGAMILYAANDDDDEIEQLRRTPDGQRWFFFRIGNEIVKWRKPYLEGAIFASGMEAALDKMKGENPEAFKLWRKAMLQEIGLNMFPVMGVVAAELWANKSLRTGAPLIPEYEQGLDPEYRVGPYSGSFERAVGEMGGVSPAIMNYLTRSFLGYWGEHVVRGVSAAMDWNATHELPPMVDWPLTQRVIARYPSSNTQAVREFYENASEIDMAAKTLQYVFNHRPDRIEAEVEQHLPQLPLIEIYNDYRQQIADLRESMGQLDEIRDIGPQTKKLYRDNFMRVIIDLAKSANEITRAVNDATAQAASMSNTQPTPSTNKQ